ncbi:MAG: hypothetical protein Q9225_004787 [Loekoesia sp. 1 TL-2023]
MASAVHTPAGDQPLQPGLGNLARLPLEIRRAIWEYFIPEDADGTRDSNLPCGPCCLSVKTPPFHLDILRISKVLYYEITTVLFRNQILTVCFNNENHPIPRFDSSTNWITFDGICGERNLHNVDFSQFTSLRLVIRSTVDCDGDDRSEWLEENIREFANYIRRWQTHESVHAKPRCLKMNVAIDICPAEPMDGDTREEVWLDDIIQVLVPLGAIPNCFIGSVEIGFALPYGQKYLAEVVRQACNNAKRSDIKFKGWRGTPFEEALALGERLTWTGGTDVITPEGMSVSVRHRAGMEQVADWMEHYGWRLDPRVVTKVTFE